MINALQHKTCCLDAYWNNNFVWAEFITNRSLIFYYLKKQIERCHPMGTMDLRSDGPKPMWHYQKLIWCHGFCSWALIKSTRNCLIAQEMKLKKNRRIIRKQRPRISWIQRQINKWSKVRKINIIQRNIWMILFFVLKKKYIWISWLVQKWTLHQNFIQIKRINIPSGTIPLNSILYALGISQKLFQYNSHILHSPHNAIHLIIRYAGTVQITRFAGNYVSPKFNED